MNNRDFACFLLAPGSHSFGMHVCAHRKLANGLHNDGETDKGRAQCIRCSVISTAVANDLTPILPNGPNKGSTFQFFIV